LVTLAPTVHERLAQCGTSVYIDGLVTGSQVVLSVGGVEYRFMATGSDAAPEVPPLQAQAEVKAKQDTGSGFSPWSPVVIVESAVSPPDSAPLLPDEVGACSQCILVSGLVPGCETRLTLDSNLIGSGTADINGAACVALNMGTTTKGRLDAVMVVCGATGPPSSAPVVEESQLPKPVMIGPLFGCQTTVSLTNLRKGAMVNLETDTGTDLGSFCSCWTSASLDTGHALQAGTQVHARQYWDGPCEATGDWSDWVHVVQPDDRIKPEILQPLVQGDDVIRVTNQFPGATLLVKIRANSNAAAREFGPRPAGSEPEIGLNYPLAAGNVVSVVQTLCGVSVESNQVTVLARPSKILPPVIVPPLYEGGTAIQVSNLYPGALVRVYMDGVPFGSGWAGSSSSISVEAAPSLVAKRLVTARQWVGGIGSPSSQPAIAVLPAPPLKPARILGPVALGDGEVWLSGVAPGAHVGIYSAEAGVLGEVDAAEPIARVSTTTPISGPIHALVRLAGRTAQGHEVAPIQDVLSQGKYPAAGQEFRSYGQWTVPATPDGDSFETRVEGQLYFPATVDGKFDPDAADLPLVVIAHGYWKPDVQSYLGYEYLALHLARWGMLVFSINMDDVNGQASVDMTYQYSRAEIILHAIDAVRSDPTLEGKVDGSRVGLVGHSMAAEGVVVAQFLNQTQSRGYGVLGVVSIAPTFWRPEVTLRDTKYMQMLGSMDLLLLSAPFTGPDSQANFDGFRIYDKAWRPKTHFYIEKARHNPFNSVWVATGDTFEAGEADLALPPYVHEMIAKCLINAFFQDALLGQAAYAGYMDGTVMPWALGDLRIHTQHSSSSRTVVDNFGDLDEQVPLTAVYPLDKSKNSLGLDVKATGSGLDEWEDVDQTQISCSPHNTKSLELSWSAPDVLYETDVGGLSVTNVTDVVAFRASQNIDDTTLNPTGQPADLFVALSDGSNEEAVVRVGSVAPVPYPPTALSAMSTVRIPVDAFEAAKPQLAHRVASVRLKLIGRVTGNILLDDLEIGT
jgi:hypothetical protein